MDTIAAADAIRDFALAMPGAHEDFPWGERVVKVDGKIFVFCGSDETLDQHMALTVKLKLTATDALEEPEATPTGYGLGRHGWVSFRYAVGSVPPHDVLLARIEESFRSVAKKRRVKEFDASR